MTTATQPQTGPGLRRDAIGLREVLFQSIAGSGTTRGHLYLAVNGLQVGVDRMRANHQLFGHLGIGVPLGHQAQYLDLAGCQSVRIGHW